MPTIYGDDLPEPIRQSWLRRLRAEKRISQKSLSRATGIKRSLISQAEIGDRGLSADSAEKIGDELGVDAWALYVDSQVHAIKTAADDGEEDRDSALASLARLRGKLRKLEKDGELPESEELDDAISELANVISELAEEEPDPEDEPAEDEEDDEPEDKPRRRRRAKKSRARGGFDPDDRDPRNPAYADAFPERDALGRRIDPDFGDEAELEPGYGDEDGDDLDRDEFGRRLNPDHGGPYGGHERALRRRS